MRDLCLREGLASPWEESVAALECGQSSLKQGKATKPAVRAKDTSTAK